MNIKHTPLALGLVALAAAATGIVPALADTSTHTYVAFGGDLTGADCSGVAQAPADQGGTCFTVTGGTVTVVIADAAAADKVNAEISFQDASQGGVGKTTEFCGSVKNVTVPASATVMFVSVGVVRGGFIFDDILGKTPDATMPCGAPSEVTEGTITATGDAIAAGSSASQKGQHHSLVAGYHRQVAAAATTRDFSRHLRLL